MQNQKTYKLNLNSTIITFFLVTRFIAIAFSLPCITDINYYLSLSSKVFLEGLTPYKDFGFEYPPLAILPILFPGLFLKTPDFASYFLLYASLMFATDCLCLFCCRYFCRKKLKMNHRQINYMTTVYSLFGLILFKLLYHRLDLMVSLFLTFSLIMFCADKKNLSFGFFTNSFLGFFYKIVPALNTPSAIILKAHNQQNSLEFVKRIITQSAIFAVILLSAVFSINFLSGYSFLENLAFHKKREIQIESFFASLLLFKDLISNKISIIYYDYNSWNIAINSSFWRIFSECFGIFILLFFYLILFLKLLFKKEKIAVSEELFLETSLLTMLIFISFQKVLSPQFFIWLIPVSAIWLTKNRSPWFLTIFSFLFFATFFIFSIDYLALTNQNPVMVCVLFLRNIILVGFTLFLTSRFFKKLS
jgi:hypothetical protein